MKRALPFDTVSSAAGRTEMTGHCPGKQESVLASRTSGAVCPDDDDSSASDRSSIPLTQSSALGCDS